MYLPAFIMAKINFNKHEVKDVCFRSMNEIESNLQTHPYKFTPWFLIAFPMIKKWQCEISSRSVIPVAKQKAFIIGAGIAGLACAIRLAVQGFEVSVFEKNNLRGWQNKCV
jgi:NADPH-dependent 2,4-dienoyl-CoA reductase/sulfur reductase-like enzyme